MAIHILTMRSPMRKMPANGRAPRPAAHPPETARGSFASKPSRRDPGRAGRRASLRWLWCADRAESAERKGNRDAGPDIDSVPRRLLPDLGRREAGVASSGAMTASGDESVLQQKAREAIRSGKSPRMRPDRRFGGLGSGETCPVCGRPVPRYEIGVRDRVQSSRRDAGARPLPSAPAMLHGVGNRESQTGEHQLGWCARGESNPQRCVSALCARYLNSTRTP